MATTVVHTRNARTTTAISLDTGDDGHDGPGGIFLFFFSRLPSLNFLSFFLFYCQPNSMY